MCPNLWSNTSQPIITKYRSPEKGPMWFSWVIDTICSSELHGCSGTLGLCRYWQDLADKNPLYTWTQWQCLSTTWLVLHEQNRALRSTWFQNKANLSPLSASNGNRVKKLLSLSTPFPICYNNSLLRVLCSPSEHMARKRLLYILLPWHTHQEGPV